jgi:hypothetical protein
MKAIMSVPDEGYSRIRAMRTKSNIFIFIIPNLYLSCNLFWGSRGRDRMVVEFTATYAISAHHHKSCEYEFRSRRGVLNRNLCDKVFSDLRQIVVFLRVLRFPHQQKKTPPTI